MSAENSAGVLTHENFITGNNDVKSTTENSAEDNIEVEEEVIDEEKAIV